MLKLTGDPVRQEARWEFSQRASSSLSFFSTQLVANANDLFDTGTSSVGRC